MKVRRSSSKAPEPKVVITRGERRAVPDRRTGDDRRSFPRPEGRRQNGGRRSGDKPDV